MSEFPSVFDMTPSEFEKAIANFNFSQSPPPPLDLADQPVQSVEQPGELPPFETNELTEVDNLGNPPINPPEFDPVGAWTEYPSPNQASTSMEPYWPGNHGGDYIYNGRVPSDNIYFCDPFSMGPQASARHAPQIPPPGFVNHPQICSPGWRPMNQIQPNGAVGPYGNHNPQHRGQAQPVFQPARYQYGPMPSYTSSPHRIPAPQSYSNTTPKASSAPHRPKSSRPKPSAVNTISLPIKDDPEIVVLSDSSDLEDPEDKALSPENSPVLNSPGLPIPSVRSRKILQTPINHTRGSGAAVGYDPAMHYQKLPKAPVNWNVFKYNKYGELTPGRLYSASDLRRYLFAHPLHQTPNGYDPKQGGLTLWIQKTPSDSLHRYGNAEAARCRFLKCSGNKNSINAETTRVAFDEISKHAHNHNPQHNAGYVHLFCLERFMDFPEICLKLDIRAENRILPLEPYGKNYMALESVQEFREAQAFITTCRTNGPPSNYPHYQTTGRPHEGTLLHRMTSKKEAARRLSQQKQREKKGHRIDGLARRSGNLELEAQKLAKSNLKQRKQQSKQAIEVSSDDDEDDEEASEDKRDHKQIRKWALRIVRQDKQNPSRERGRQAKADLEWAKEYLKSNATQKSRPEIKEKITPMARPSSKLERKSGRDKRFMSPIEQSEEELQPRRRNLIKCPVNEREENEQRLRPKIGKRRRYREDDSEQDSDESPELRRSKRTKRAIS